MPHHSTEDFEGQFAVRIDEAWELVRVSADVVYRYVSVGPSLATPVHTAAWRLHLVAAARQLSVLQCLRMKETSEGASALLRGLLEAWAHLDFLSDDGQEDTARCRAIRWQLGDLLEVEGLGKELRAAGATAAQLVELDDLSARRADLLAAATDCRCRDHPPWTRARVPAVLKAVAQQDPRLRWIVALYGSTSSGVHMYGSNQLLHVDDLGQATVTWVLPSVRTQYLTWANVAYGKVSQLTERAMSDDPHDSGFFPRMQALLEDPLLREAGRGRFDT